MIREDFENLQELMVQVKKILDKVDVKGCGKYFKIQDRYCGHRYNWKSLKGFKMDVWLCDKCLNLIGEKE